MNDPAVDWLTSAIQQERPYNALWCSDENVLHALVGTAHLDNKPLLMTNRWDVARRANEHGFKNLFSDFDFSPIEDQSFSHVFYRISKEKPVTHHIINAAHRVIAPGGKLFLSGQKNEGIKTYIDKASALFCCPTSARKSGTTYTAILEKAEKNIGPLLDDSNYAELRPIASVDHIAFYSKPGLFGWNKIDQGSEFLIQQLPSLFNNQLHAPRNFLDLGCGYGYLTLMTAGLDLEERVLTDNNAAALSTAQFNCEHNKITAKIIAADCGDQIRQSFDLILCNPPFHQGFAVDGDLTDKFIRNAKRLLAKGGIALFVVNQFIPLERKAREYFTKVELMANNGSFKVIALRH